MEEKRDGAEETYEKREYLPSPVFVKEEIGLEDENQVPDETELDRLCPLEIKSEKVDLDCKQEDEQAVGVQRPLLVLVNGGNYSKEDTLLENEDGRQNANGSSQEATLEDEPHEGRQLVAASDSQTASPRMQYTPSIICRGHTYCQRSSASDSNSMVAKAEGTKATQATGERALVFPKRRRIPNSRYINSSYRTFSSSSDEEVPHSLQKRKKRSQHSELEEDLRELVSPAASNGTLMRDKNSTERQPHQLPDQTTANQKNTLQDLEDSLRQRRPRCPPLARTDSDAPKMTTNDEEILQHESQLDIQKNKKGSLDKVQNNQNNSAVKTILENNHQRKDESIAKLEAEIMSLKKAAEATSAGQCKCDGVLEKLTAVDKKCDEIIKKMNLIETKLSKIECRGVAGSVMPVHISGSDKFEITEDKVNLGQGVLCFLPAWEGMKVAQYPHEWGTAILRGVFGDEAKNFRVRLQQRSEAHLKKFPSLFLEVAKGSCGSRCGEGCEGSTKGMDAHETVEGCAGGGEKSGRHCTMSSSLYCCVTLKDACTDDYLPNEFAVVDCKNNLFLNFDITDGYMSDYSFSICDEKELAGVLRPHSNMYTCLFASSAAEAMYLGRVSERVFIPAIQDYNIPESAYSSLRGPACFAHQNTKTHCALHRAHALAEYMEEVQPMKHRVCPCPLPPPPSQHAAAVFDIIIAATAFVTLRRRHHYHHHTTFARVVAAT